MSHTITEYTDEQRRAEYHRAENHTSRAPRLVTKGGKISAYGMGCGYIYQIVADHPHGGFARLTMTPEGDGYYVNYFDNLRGTRTKGFRHFERKRDAERCFDRLAKVVRAEGRANINGNLPFEFTFREYGA